MILNHPNKPSLTDVVVKSKHTVPIALKLSVLLVADLTDELHWFFRSFKPHLNCSSLTN